MNVQKRLQEIGRDDYQGFLAEIHDAWAKQCTIARDGLSDFLSDSTLPDLDEDFTSFIPTIKNGIAYFSCAKRFGGDDWKDGEIGIPSKIWWRFLYHPKTTFVTWRMVS